MNSLKATHAERETALQTVLSKTHKQLTDYESALNALQERYEEGSRSFLTLQREKRVLEEKATKSERTLEHLKKENVDSKEKYKTLEAELRSACAALFASPTSAIADLEKANAELRQHRADKTAMEKKLESAKNESEYVRRLYQEASQSAAESANRVRELEAENKILQTKASVTVTNLAAISQHNENAVLRNQNAGLEAMLKDREELLRRKEEESRELRRGRGMGTRGTSVKPGSSPRGSRGVSPVAGEPMTRTGSKGLGSTLRYGH